MIETARSTVFLNISINRIEAALQIKTNPKNSNSVLGKTISNNFPLSQYKLKSNVFSTKSSVAFDFPLSDSQAIFAQMPDIIPFKAMIRLPQLQ